MGTYKSQVAKTTYFDNTANGFVSQEVQSAIEEVKAAITTSGSEQHSWNMIDTDKTILNNRQMLVYQEVEILGTNTLYLEGELVILD